MDGEKRFVGIDIAKAALDVFIGSGEAAFSVTNDEVGIRELLRHLAPGDFVILEATGGLEMPAASALAAAGIAVAIVNPRQVRDFARAAGRLAKTDRLDAEVLARFGEAVRPEARPLGNLCTGPNATAIGHSNENYEEEGRQARVFAAGER
jgi:transposase